MYNICHRLTARPIKHLQACRLRNLNGEVPDFRLQKHFFRLVHLPSYSLFASVFWIHCSRGVVGFYWAKGLKRGSLALFGTYRGVRAMIGDTGMRSAFQTKTRRFGGLTGLKLCSIIPMRSNSYIYLWFKSFPFSYCSESEGMFSSLKVSCMTSCNEYVLDFCIIDVALAIVAFYYSY